MDQPQIRLNKHLAHTLGISRREADDLIEQKRIFINGDVASLGARFDESQAITLDGKLISSRPHNYTYVALNKPPGYVCSRRAQGDSPTIYELLPKDMHKLKPVGRLDRDSSGLLLLTDDGDFAYRMTHPSFHKTKNYDVTLDKPLEPLHRQMISDHGIALDDGPSRLQLERQSDGDDLSWKVTMHEGRNRQIRRTFAALGYTVTYLHRTNFGSYELGPLAPGKTAVVEPN